MMTKFPLKMPLFMGKGTRQTTEELCAQTSPEACVAAIGPAGENLVPLSGLINSRKPQWWCWNWCRTWC